MNSRLSPTSHTHESLIQPETCARILTVSALTALIRSRLEEPFRDIWLEGEVSNVRMPASGHIYFTLKDETSQIRAILFRLAAQHLRFDLREGLHVIVRGRLSVYEPRGEYQLAVDHAEPKGIGALQLAFEQLKERLAGEGLFDPRKKRPLPILPKRIGIVSSLAGAALQDMLVVLERRCPIVHVILAPVPVQGAEAAPLISDAIKRLGDLQLIDVMIVGRGGGSLEDLWCFNDERVVRAIAAAPVPVVSAVGHETDVTLADFVADYRAPTPSAAAEAVVPVLDEMVAQIGERSARLRRTIRHRIELARRSCLVVQGRLRERAFPIYRRGQRLDDVWTRLQSQLVRDLLDRQQRRQELAHRIVAEGPQRTVRASAMKVSHIQVRLQDHARMLVSKRRQLLARLLGKLDSLSPLATMRRGFSVLQTLPQGKVVRRADQVREGQMIKATVSVGVLLCQVRKIAGDPNLA
ncbi:MAG: exodeoxyribonuclease VII large subunit [Nitrospiraceae bacterium]